MWSTAGRNVRLSRKIEKLCDMISAQTVTEKELRVLSIRDLPAGERKGKRALFVRPPESAALQRYGRE